ncbi:expressed protein [Dictyostelium purpureum]|uniref:Expressed protein n=1 Tax=Dictyostelium purpureum TaxID=5786 RepID=F1A373_DICPU|nr:uncharacterized protein DICPUDRAFT_99860 [Dictyostelium purpureum]EGC29355.1 expressed protein [Dictyostelium purpureum]|eukprot:XP_003294119.1 expressed protein [Dictyostelium purpureum]
MLLKNISLLITVFLIAISFTSGENVQRENKKFDVNSIVDQIKEYSNQYNLNQHQLISVINYACSYYPENCLLYNGRLPDAFMLYAKTLLKSKANELNQAIQESLNSNTNNDFFKISPESSQKLQKLFIQFSLLSGPTTADGVTGNGQGAMDIQNIQNNANAQLAAAQQLIQKAKLEAEAKEAAKKEAEKKEAERKLKHDEKLKKKEKEAAELKEKQEREKKEKEAAELKAKKEQEQKEKEAAELKAKQEQEQKARDSLKNKIEEELRAKLAAETAEKARLAAEVEKAKQAAEKAQQAAEAAEKAKQAAEAEKAKQAAEAEKAKQAAEAEKAKQAEAEKAKQAEADKAKQSNNMPTDKPDYLGQFLDFLDIVTQSKNTNDKNIQFKQNTSPAIKS